MTDALPLKIPMNRGFFQATTLGFPLFFPLFVNQEKPSKGL
jgi:hypothetical protein